MKAVILAGGSGTRLQEEVPDVPKVMAPINGKPFLEYLLKILKKNYIKDVILSVGYKKESIIRHFNIRKNVEMNISFSEEDKPLGTGGAVKKAIDQYGDGSKIFFVFNGDCLTDANLFEMFESHLIYTKQENDGRLATMLAVEVSDTSRYGRLDGSNKKITKMTEKGMGGRGFINGGCYIFNIGIKKYLKKKCSLEKDVFPKLIKKEKLFYWNDDVDNFIDIGTPEDYRKLCNEDFDKWKKIVS